MLRRAPLLSACVFIAVAAAPLLAREASIVTSTALRAANPNALSGGLFSALDADGVFGAPPVLVKPIRAGMVDLSKGKPGAVLDARVGANLRLGDDPAVLPTTQLGQAEPHVFRCAANPSLLLATFQEGRFSDAGSLDCGYSVSVDGGLTWTRALIPQLTTTSGGTFNRATDPVAAIGPQGDLYLNTLDSISGAFASASIVVSRSTDNGATWSAPIPVFTSTVSTVGPDKNWIAVNDFAGTTTVGRLVVTWTNFTSTAAGAATGNNIRASISDDRGMTWTPPLEVTPLGSINQGSQPVFLPDGSLALVYVTFPNLNATSPFTIECKRSTDGGRTFPATSAIVAANVVEWDDPNLRTGAFLPSAAAARQTGDLFVTYTAVISGSPRVVVTKSSDKGATWTPPIVVSDNPAGSSVVNPAVAVTPDGRNVSVVFHDKRNASDGHNFVDTYVALSFDGGTTWQPNVRLTDLTTDIRFATLTTRGYFLGDYLGVASPVTQNATSGLWDPCVAIWCDARTGDADPFTVRFSPNPTPNLTTWASARAVSTSGSADTDADREPDPVEYVIGTDPRVAESGEDLYVTSAASGTVDVAWAQRANPAGDSSSVVAVLNPAPSTFVDGALTSTGQFQVAAGTPLTAAQLPTVVTRAGLTWTGFRYAVPAGATLAVARAVPGAGGTQVAGPVTAFNTDSRLINVSTRGSVGTAASQMIVGFVIDGQKTMLLRAVGPGLAAFGVAGVLAAPQLGLLASGSSTALANATAATTAQSASVAAQVGAFPLSAGDLALAQSLPAGGYTAVLSGANSTTGIALVEAYDADPAPGAPTGPRVVNLSTRGAVVGGSSALIAGFVIKGTQPRRVLIRAVGPTLATFGVSGVLSDPLLTLYGTGASAGVLATNDDWELSRSGAAVAATAQRLGAFALTAGSLDSALLITLAPGGYTATVIGVNGATGVALVEVYDAD